MLDIPVKSFPKTSRIWIYQSSKMLTPVEVDYINRELNKFVSAWTAHDAALEATAWINNNLFLCFMVDEDEVSASGCSIDKSVAFVRSLGDCLNIDWFDRMQFAYRDDNGNIQLVYKSELKSAYENGDINDDTMFFDTLITNRAAYDQSFSKPLKDSWHFKFVK